MAQAASRLRAALLAALRHVHHLLERGDHHDARREIGALRAEPALSPAYRALLEALDQLAHGDEAGATARLEEVLRQDPGNAHAHFWVGELHARAGRLPEAIRGIEDALSADPQMPEAWSHYGGLALQAGDHNLAMHSLVRAIELDVDNHRFWSRLNQWLPRLQIRGDMAPERGLLVRAFRRRRIEFPSIDGVIYAALRASPTVQQLVGMALEGTLHERIRGGEALGALDDDFLRLLLQHVTLHDPGAERLLTELRRALADAVAAARVAPAHRDTTVRFLASLGIYAWTCEYALATSGPEERALAACRERLAGAGDEELPLLAAMVACYEPLSGLPPAAAQRVLGSAAAGRLPEFAELVDLQVLEPLRLARYRATVPVAGSIDNSVSRAVQQQYEENPYPRWRFLGVPEAIGFDSRIARALPGLPEDQRPRLQASADDPLDILIAGCGTGRHAVWCGREHRHARVLAVDLSRASLAYGSMKAAELEVGNVEFLQADLLGLPALGRTFDLIESVGVLHHMEDPAAGLAALARCLRPGGWMKVALYSRLARRAVTEARARIAAGGHAATPSGIREFRRAIMTNPADPLHAVCLRWRDFYTLSDCRDLLFHVQEHQFTTDGLTRLIGGAGLEFMGFETHLAAARDTPPHVRDPRSLAEWGRFEEAHPDTFGGMYVMWLRKPA